MYKITQTNSWAYTLRKNGKVISKWLKYENSNQNELQSWLDDWLKSAKELDEMYYKKYFNTTQKEIDTDIDEELSLTEWSEEDIKNTGLMFEFIWEKNEDALKIHQQIIRFWWNSEIIAEWKWKLNVFSSITRKSWRKKYLLFSETMEYEKYLYFWKNYKVSEKISADDFLKLEAQDEFEEFIKTLIHELYESDFAAGKIEESHYLKVLNGYVDNFWLNYLKWIWTVYAKVMPVKSSELVPLKIDLDNWKKITIDFGQTTIDWDETVLQCNVDYIHRYLNAVYEAWELTSSEKFIESLNAINGLSSIEVEAVTANKKNEVLNNENEMLSNRAEKEYERVWKHFEFHLNRMESDLREILLVIDKTYDVLNWLTDEKDTAELENQLDVFWNLMKKYENKKYTSDFIHLDLIERACATFNFTEGFASFHYDWINKENFKKALVDKENSKTVGWFDFQSIERFTAKSVEASIKISVLNKIYNAIKLDKNEYSAKELLRTNLWYNEIYNYNNIKKITELFTEKIKMSIKDKVKENKLIKAKKEKAFNEYIAPLIKKIENKFEEWVNYILQETVDYADEFDVQLISIFDSKSLIKTLNSIKNYDDICFNKEITVCFWSNQEIELEYTDFKKFLLRSRKSSWKWEENALKNSVGSDVVSMVDEFFECRHY